MKSLFVFIALLYQVTAYGQKNVTISSTNDYEDVYHLSLIIYTPDGQNQIRVGNLEPKQVKTYSFPVGTEIYIADWKQEAFAMKGNDIKATGAKPAFVLTDNKDKVAIILSALPTGKETKKE